jgi:hypothetical protein
VEKLKISRSIVGEIRNHGGRFLERHRDEWREIGEKKAVEKTSQALREGQPKLRQTMDVELGGEHSVAPALVVVVDSPFDTHSHLQQQQQQQQQQQHAWIQHRVLQETIAQHQQVLPIQLTDESYRMTEQYGQPNASEDTHHYVELEPLRAIRDPATTSVASINELLPRAPSASQNELTGDVPRYGASNELAPTQAPAGDAEITDRGNMEDHANLLLMLSRKVSKTVDHSQRFSDEQHLAAERERVAWCYSGASMSGWSNSERWSEGTTTDRLTVMNPQRRFDRRRLFAKVKNNRSKSIGNLNVSRQGLERCVGGGTESTSHLVGGGRNKNFSMLSSISHNAAADDSTNRKKKSDANESSRGNRRSISLPSPSNSSSMHPGHVSSENHSVVTDLARRLGNVSTQSISMGGENSGITVGGLLVVDHRDELSFRTNQGVETTAMSQMEVDV